MSWKQLEKGPDAYLSEHDLFRLGGRLFDKPEQSLGFVRSRYRMRAQEAHVYLCQLVAAKVVKIAAQA